MKIKRTAVLLTAAAIAMSSFCSLTAGAVVFMEDEATGIKTWKFEVNDNSAYAEGITTDDKGDKIFAKNNTYYVSDGYSKTKPDENDYLILNVKNEGCTIESAANDAIYLRQAKNDATLEETESSVITYNVPSDGTITVTGDTSKNTVHLQINEGEAQSGHTVSANVMCGDEITIYTAGWSAVEKVEFTPNDTYTELYSFTQKPSEFKNAVLKIGYEQDNAENTIERNISDKLPTVEGDAELKLGLIINDIPNDVTINSVVIE